MIEKITISLQQFGTEPIGLLFALLLGMFSTLTSSCCALPTLGVMLGYSGSQEKSSKNISILMAVFFTLGTFFSLMIIGFIGITIGHYATDSLGKYWKIFAGIMLIFFGLFILKLLPFNLPIHKLNKLNNYFGQTSVILMGFILGAIISITALCCMPALFVMMGLAIAQHKIIHATLLLMMFAIGFSVPLGTLVFGVSLFKNLLISQKVVKYINYITAAILFIVGYYFIFTY